MKEYEIWMEGYQATGQQAGASFVGVSEGRNFKDACKKFYQTQSKTEQAYYDVKDNTYWGCGLFPTQSQAIRSFG
jgi:hypothetical protein